MLIDKPTRGRVVHYTTTKGETCTGLVEECVSERGAVHIIYFDFERPTARSPMGKEVHLALGVPFASTPRPNSWRYPPRSTEQIDV